MMDYETRRLKSYKGYNITKIWDITATGKRINVQYIVSDDEENAIINVLDSLAKAKKYIDIVLT